ncbi:MAG: peptidylprolyl isomerase [Deltaproteobacteria bacterium]|jgi:FKBP-type peptidyl-prolyl cis-trans isomerase 2|nr:MAG: peptidylprolyl isomerase [Deltaproteobacteria bacterium]
MRKVQMGDHVNIEYEGMLENGEVIERSSETGPVEFEVGSGIMPLGFEKALIGMSEGEEKTITLTPDEAFGPRDEELLHTVNRSVFGEEIEPKPGMVLGMTVEKEGQPHKVPALIEAVNGENVTIDFNHPLAGKTLNYKLTLKAIK